MLLGPGCPSTGLSTLVRPSFATSFPPALDMKPYMPFSFDPSPISMLSGFSNMDPVQKAVLNHTFGVAPPPRKKSLIMCTICQIRFNSESQAEAHYKGNKHARRRKASESGKKQTSMEESSNGSKTSKQLVKMDSASKSPADSNKKSAVQVQLALPAPKPQSNGQRADTPPTPQTSTIGGITAAKVTTQGVTSITKRPGETEEEKAKRLLYCSLCKVAVNSASQLEAHYSGSKHKAMVEVKNGGGAIRILPQAPGTTERPGVLQGRTFRCDICEVLVNSEGQLKQHVTSRRHKDKMAGKPAKPKFAPYSKPQRRSTPVMTKISFPKSLAQTLNGGYIFAPMAHPATIPHSCAKLSYSTEPLKPLGTSFFSPQLLATPSAAATALALRPTTAAFFPAAPTLVQTLLRPAPGPIRPLHGQILYTPY